jgi:hypothetical protein
MPEGMIQIHLISITRAEETCISRGKKIKQSSFVKVLNEQTGVGRNTNRNIQI